MATNRTYRPVEARLVSEYLASQWSAYRTVQHVRVGAFVSPGDDRELTPGESRMLGTWRRWIDAIVIRPASTLLIEAAVIPHPGDISMLEAYMRLWPATPEFPEARDRPAAARLVYAVYDQTVEALAMERGILTEVFSPPWVKDYLDTLYPRKRRAPVRPIPGAA